MGDTIECRAQFNKQTSDGKALLETEELIFRGDFRVKVPLKDIKSVKVREGKLVVVSPQGTLTLELGPRAEKWAQKILNPKSVIDKLGVKAGQRVGIVGFVGPDAESFLGQLKERGVEASVGRAKAEFDAIFFLASEAKALARFATLIPSLKKNGAIWIVFPKGRKEIREADVLEQGRETGLVDVKVVAFSPVYTALKFVVPVADR
ncbi:MAG: hypothetical protein ACREDR_13310 [Blastocatellia bacterium]